MAHERSTIITHTENPDQKRYDWNYYNALMPHIYGQVLDIGTGAGMFVKEYVTKPEVTIVQCLDKFTEQIPLVEKVMFADWVCPQDLPGFVLANNFDTVVSTEFIEHITREQLEPLIEQIKIALKDDGVFVGSTPNKKVPTTNPYHLYEYTLPELKKILEQHFSEVTIWDCGQDCTVWVAKK